MALVAYSHADAEAGTLYMRNGHPLMAVAGAPDFEEAGAESGVRTDLTYLSVFTNEENNHWRTVVDMEAAVLDFRASAVFGSSVVFGVDVPVYYYFAGFLDGPLDSYHGIIGTGKGGREKRPEDDYLYLVQHDGKTIVKGSRDQFSLGDVRPWGKWLFHKGRNVTAALYGYMDMPTGDSYRGYGNGSVDWGAALLTDYRYDEDIEFFANIGRVLPGDYDGHGRIRLYDYFYAAFGVAWRYSDRTSIITQAMWGQSPYRMDMYNMDDDWVLWGLGVEYDTGRRGNLHLIFTEDPSPRVSPDFMLTLGYKYRL